MLELDETQKAIEQALRQFCAREVEPLVPRLESGEASPYDLLRKMSEVFSLGELLGGPLKKRAERLRAGGGMETDPQTRGFASDPVIAALFSKELSRVSPGVCLCVAANVGCGSTIAAKGDADLIERCAIPVLSFQKVGCWALTEPGSGSDAFAMKTTARVQGDEVILHGSKTFISNAPFADVFLIYARLDEPAGNREDKRRIFPVVVERGTPGLSTGPAMKKLGMHAAPTGEIFLDECRVPRRNLLGDPASPARDLAEGTLATERAAIVAMCLGVIERCLDDSLAFATTRMQFGKPIAAFQLIQEKLARMYVAQQNVRNLMFKLIWLQQQGTATEREVSAAKWYASESAAAVALEAMQLMGGAGYMQEHAPERLFRDIKLWTIGGGTSEIQALTIAKDLLRGYGLVIDLAGGHRQE
jgi:alkylation response protein AidB-like acyl-CoA dehydrogenase